jgi:hypothetical protein
VAWRRAALEHGPPGLERLGPRDTRAAPGPGATARVLERYERMRAATPEARHRSGARASSALRDDD